MDGKNTGTQTTSLYPPVVAVLGHVDHGKTSLLDSIRKTNIASREHGGITQKIGASSVEFVHEGHTRRITFIDTPGHEAFTSMRSRGARVADIALLIVSSVDGVMPQTKESIELLKGQHIPYIVVLTKSDLPEKNAEKVKQQLLKEEILLEGYGGDTPVIEVSSRTGTNIKELLSLILLALEMHQPDEAKMLSEDAPVEAVVIESKLDQKSGPKATIVIKNGTIRVKDDIQTGEVEGRVRALITDQGVSLPKATIGEAVEVLGFQMVPSVGSVVTPKVLIDEKKEVGAQESKPVMDISEGSLAVILAADTKGSLEAITYSFPQNVSIIAQKTGEISEADVAYAKTTNAIILSFNTKVRPEVAKLALTEKILLKNYTIIYEMLDEIKEVMEGKRQALLEHIYGSARILASFPFDKSIVLGVSILDGRIARGDKVRIMRGEAPIGESSIISVRQGKNSVSKVDKGQEAGVMISPFLDFEVGDVILSHS